MFDLIWVFQCRGTNVFTNSTSQAANLELLVVSSWYASFSCCCPASVWYTLYIVFKEDPFQEKWWWKNEISVGYAWGKRTQLHTFAFWDLSLYPRIYEKGWTERAIILCKLHKSLLESSKSVGIHRQKSFYSLKNLLGPIKCEKMFCLLCDF